MEVKAEEQQGRDEDSNIITTTCIIPSVAFCSSISYITFQTVSTYIIPNKNFLPVFFF